MKFAVQTLKMKGNAKKNGKQQDWPQSSDSENFETGYAEPSQLNEQSK